MNAERVTNQLEQNASVIVGLVSNLPLGQADWKPSPDAWSILEVMAHLLDEEREDFRARIDAVLHLPGEPWPPIDPQGWVKERDYASRDLGETLESFLAEREVSVSWLRDLTVVDWGVDYEHPALGSLRAGDLLASWLAHDYLHIRQLTRLHWQFHARRIEPYGTEYAGEWS